MQVAGSVFILRSPEVTWKDTSSIFPETKKIQSWPNLSFMPTKTGLCWKLYSLLMVMVWFWLFCTLWARRHNYLHITKLSQTAATRNQQVSVNDKRCLSKRKRISQLAAAAALQTSRSGWIWEPATLWRSGFSSSSDHLGIIISRFPTCPPACCPINDDQLWGMVMVTSAAVCITCIVPFCVRVIYYATLWSGIPALQRLKEFFYFLM